ncbi:hypothetical protein ACS0TY_008352 [Phlomoides rotata]
MHTNQTSFPFPSNNFPAQFIEHYTPTKIFHYLVKKKRRRRSIMCLLLDSFNAHAHIRRQEGAEIYGGNAIQIDRRSF